MARYRDAGARGGQTTLRYRGSETSAAANASDYCYESVNERRTQGKRKEAFSSFHARRQPSPQDDHQPSAELLNINDHNHDNDADKEFELDIDFSSSEDYHNETPTTPASTYSQFESTSQSSNSSTSLLEDHRAIKHQDVVSTLLQLIKRRKRLFNNVLYKRMVLEPKFTDYGSIHSIGEVVNRQSGQQQQSQQQQQQQQAHQVDLEHTSAAVFDLIGVNGATPLSQQAHPAGNQQSQQSQQQIMTQGDLYQRQPLLATPAKSDKWSSRGDPHEYPMDDDDEIIPMKHPHGEPNGVIKINMPAPVREEPRFPQERLKTLLAAVSLFVSSLLVLISLSMVHERVPDRQVYGPLPDVFFDLFGVRDWGLTVSEYLIIFAFNSTLVVIVLHKHRFIILRRLFLIMTLLYIYRAITMFVTVLPISSTTYYCSPKSNHTTTLDTAKRVIQMFSGMGLSINGKQTYCGDFIYSGHTLTMVISYLFIAEYTPKKLYLIHWLYWLVAATGVFMLQLSRSHYTIDVIIAYYVTTRIFWIYHSLANNSSLKQQSEKNLLARVWWFSIFTYFEGNVGGQIPRQWPDWPLPWPRRFHTKSRDS